MEGRGWRKRGGVEEIRGEEGGREDGLEGKEGVKRGKEGK